MTTRVLLTGATGFVGRQVLKALHASSVRVRAIAREVHRDALVAASGVESVVVTADLFGETHARLLEVCTGVDTVIHAAWYAEPGKYLQSPLNLDCLSGTLALARAAAAAKVRRFVGVGTCFEYDLTGNTPLTTDTPLRPLTPYAGAKAAAFMALSQWLPPQGVEFAWCRLFYLYGKGEDPRRLVPYLRAKLAAGEPAELTSGRQVRDFLDVEEAGKAIAATATSSRQGPVNVCSGQAITVRQLAERIADEFGRRDLLQFDARPENLVDPPFVVGAR
jgi:dTDP-6-deoxy-L-talose 4-dehydrogenase (NAD+)